MEREKSLKVTQGQFSYLPDLTPQDIKTQLQYYLGLRLTVGIEYTKEPHPRNSFWDMWGIPMFNRTEVLSVYNDVVAACNANPGAYVKVVIFDSRRGVESCVASFIVQRPKQETRYKLNRIEERGRIIRYSIATAE